MRGRVGGKVRSALRLVADHPAWNRSCADCQRYIFGENGIRSDVPTPGPDGHPLRDAAGRAVMVPQVRPKGVSPPCGVCPKLDGVEAKAPLADADDPCGESAGWVWGVVRGVRGLLAWGQPPPDPTTELIGVVVAEHDCRGRRRELADAVEGGIRRALSKR